MRKPSNMYGAISQTTCNKDQRKDFIVTKVLILCLFRNCSRKPEGFWGRLIVAGMNSGPHAALAIWGLDFGGGANLQRLMQRSLQGKVTGVDYSPVSVEKSRKVNANAIANGRCTVLEASVSSLPFNDNTFNMATAFETSQPQASRTSP